MRIRLTEMVNGEVDFFPDFIDQSEASAMLEKLEKEIEWTQEHVKIYGNRIPLPRLTAWYGDTGRKYSYSGIIVKPEPWTPLLLDIKGRVENVSGDTFNSVLLNMYRSGKDSVSWHSDDEPELGIDPVIASVSFGASRVFKLKPIRVSDELEQKIDLTNGSLLLMAGKTQANYRHCVPKTTKNVGPRINLTFRTIIY